MKLRHAAFFCRTAPGMNLTPANLYQRSYRSAAPELKICHGAANRQIVAALSACSVATLPVGPASCNRYQQGKRPG